MLATTAPVLTTRSVQESYRFCEGVARARAKNFYYSFLLLEPAQRNAMCAVYAFMRHCDDLSDDPAAGGELGASESVAGWSAQLDRALAGDLPDHPIWPAFHDTVQRYAIPHRYFHEMIDGITSDLEPRQIQTFEELYDYCYKVASVVGLTVIHIFGFESPDALRLAEECGIAFQITNILRDVREDAELNRLYLPQEDLDRFGVTFAQLRLGTEDDGFRRLMKFEAERARDYYRRSEPLTNLIQPKSRRSLWALREIYVRLLNKIEAANFNVLSRRVRVPTATKLGLLVLAWFR